ncbi:type II toxin-antitoxin system VapC family toxin [Thermococcus sp. MAR1]|uniref:type II toxin-antitoxin system VapC family toxin n=1 Tax=Thermococcus sp. MAR1 TaxID=1638263 RepID=UPI0014397C8C|nr:type II toxin-antitoxin system VapC family toxin [Thermococcus sp. MAR1]NJE09576.1 type II toxin-antitoxin system VapC family toxin [Thermococcus sp. MAR1]
MTKRVLIDSNVFVEYLKGNPKAMKVLSSLLSSEYEIFINAIVYSEVVFLFISKTTGLSAFALKKKPPAVVNSGVEKVLALLQQFKIAEINEVVLQTASEIITRHGLLPNDAIILATAKIYDMTLATLDSDFGGPAKEEGVPLYSP